MSVLPSNSGCGAPRCSRRRGRPVGAQAVPTGGDGGGGGGGPGSPGGEGVSLMGRGRTAIQAQPATKRPAVVVRSRSTQKSSPSSASWKTEGRS